MLHRDPSQRIEINDKNELKNDEFFEGLDWNKLAEKNYPTPLLDEEEFEDELSPFDRVRNIIIFTNYLFIVLAY